jgi:hypothetical protein
MTERTRENFRAKPSRQAARGGAGLCSSCRHARTKSTPRGSAFWRCELAGQNPDFPRYPALPVTRCEGYEEADGPPRA